MPEANIDTTGFRELILAHINRVESTFFKAIDARTPGISQEQKEAMLESAQRSLEKIAPALGRLSPDAREQAKETALAEIFGGRELAKGAVQFYDLEKLKKNISVLEAVYAHAFKTLVGDRKLTPDMSSVISIAANTLAAEELSQFYSTSAFSSMAIAQDTGRQRRNLVHNLTDTASFSSPEAAPSVMAFESAIRQAISEIIGKKMKTGVTM